jgi:fatty acid synthase subunit alpha
VHSLVSPYDIDTRSAILCSYFQAIVALERQHIADIPRTPIPALFSAAASGKASVYALFGGQGTNEVYFDELQFLYDTYRPFVEPFITTLTQNVLEPLSAARQGTMFYNHGMDVVSWLSDAALRPPLAYLASVPVSLPLIGLTQLVQYLVVCRVSGLTPGELRSRISGTTGHSQGVVSAVAIAASSSFESLTDNSCKAVKWLLFAGCRAQEVFPVVSLEPSIVQDTLDGGEGLPSPMLSITGLLLKDLEPHVKNANSHLPQNSKLTVSLHNGSKAFVVTGPARALYGLVTSLRKIRAASTTEQSKVPFSQRTPVFSVRFLVVAAPFHSVYMNGASERVCQDDLGGEELWKTEDLHIPVYHTENGSLFAHLSICVTATHIHGN